MNTLDDLMFLFGSKPRPSYTPSRKINNAEITGENDWLEGKNADENPFLKGTTEHDVWYRAWYKMNLNA